LGSLALKYELLLIKPLKFLSRYWSLFILSKGAGYEVPRVPVYSVGKTLQEIGVVSLKD
jgi:hypothetical protein